MFRSNRILVCRSSAAVRRLLSAESLGRALIAHVYLFKDEQDAQPTTVALHFAVLARSIGVNCDYA